MSRPRSLAELLARPGRALADLLQRTRETDRLTDLVRSALPLELSGHVVAASLHNGELTVYADASVWAARLRFTEGPLREQLGSRGLAFERLRLRVRPVRPHS